MKERAIVAAQTDVEERISHLKMVYNHIHSFSSIRSYFRLCVYILCTGSHLGVHRNY